MGTSIQWNTAKPRTLYVAPSLSYIGGHVPKYGLSEAYSGVPPFKVRAVLDADKQMRLALASCAGLLLIGICSFWWLCVRSPNISYLPRHEGAEWVIYPKPPDLHAHSLAELSAEFRRSFVLARVPPKAVLSIRAMRRFEIAINGKPVLPGAPAPNWKDETVFDVSPLLHTGSNEVLVTVFNKRGPPALWLTLDAGTFRTAAGADWKVSLAGAAWRGAWPAAVPVPPEHGHELEGGEGAVASLYKEGPVMLVLVALSLVVFVVGSRIVNKYRALGEPRGPLDSRSLAARAIIVLALLWVALFLNNLGQLPNDTGYDNAAHLDYIKYIRTHWRLPLATDGWEMCQPPLYYLIGAVLLAPLHAATTSGSAVLMLRLFGLLLAITNFTLVFMSARLLFPKQPANQFFCLLLAAFLPAQIYLAQYVTNELLSAVLVTAALYFCIRLIKSETCSAIDSAATGFFLGAALLTKATAIVAMPVILGAVAAWPLLHQRGNLRAWLRTFGIAALLTVAVGGGHYLRVWRHFGTPLVHDWDEASGFAWWTESGFHTRSSAFGFGESLVHPFYSSLHSFADGVYSTLWGDGQYGGETAAESRPPWNYSLMAADYLLALAPTIIILIGLAVAVVRFIRRPRAVWFLLLGTGSATFAALLYMNLKLPFQCNAKAFYGLIALLPICAVGAVGFEVLSRATGRLRPVLWVFLGVCALGGFGSFWIRSNAAATHRIRGEHLCQMDSTEAGVNELSAALLLDPHDLPAERCLTLLQASPADAAQARQKAERLVSENPGDGRSFLVLAKVLASQNQLEPACQSARRAVELAPGLAEAHKRLCTWLAQLGKDREAVAAGREALRLEPVSAGVDFTLGAAFDRLGDRDDAVKYFRLGCNFNPGWPEGHDLLGETLAEANKWDEAAGQFSTACRLNPDSADFRLQLGTACESAGKPADAVKAYREALKLNPNLAAALNGLAWQLATNPDERLRDGKEAVALAQRACRLTENKTAQFLGTLAAAYAEAGNYAAAVATARKAIELARAAGNEDMAAANTRLVELYRANKPYHQ